MALYLVIQVSALLSRFVPRSWRYLLGTAVGDVVFAVWASKRRALESNMATVLGAGVSKQEVRRVARKSMRNYCKYLVEFLDLPNLDPEHSLIASLEIQGEEHLKRAIARGKGLIVASGHFGTLELGGIRLATMTDFHAVYDSFSPAYLDDLIRRKRLEKGIKLIPVNNVRAMLHVLHRGGTVTTIFDRPMKPGKGVKVRFFGKEAHVPGGPAMLAMKTDAVLLPVFVYRRPDRTFLARICPPIPREVTGNREADLQRITQHLTDALQSAIASAPDQWYMFRPMWPAGTSSSLGEPSPRMATAG